MPRAAEHRPDVADPRHALPGPLEAIDDASQRCRLLRAEKRVQHPIHPRGRLISACRIKDCKGRRPRGHAVGIAAGHQVELEPQMRHGLVDEVPGRLPAPRETADALPGGCLHFPLVQKGCQPRGLAVASRDALLEVDLLVPGAEPALEPGPMDRRQHLGDLHDRADGVVETSSGASDGATTSSESASPLTFGSPQLLRPSLDQEGRMRGCNPVRPAGSTRQVGPSPRADRAA